MEAPYGMTASFSENNIAFYFESNITPLRRMVGVEMYLPSFLTYGTFLFS
jgi:hypothetical protein